MTIERLSPWLVAVRAAGPAGVRVLCFPHAGGGASAYMRWAAEPSDGIEFCAVQLPGREGQIGVRPFANLDQLLPVICAELRPYLDRPFALFGHSMGALVAFEFARALQRAGGPVPAHVFVSGRRAPHLPPQRRPLHALPPGEFEAALAELEGTPREVLLDAELMDLLGPALRADLELCETYQYRQGDPLDMPLSVFGGVDDPETTPADLDAWRIHARAFMGVRVFPGNHFYLRDRARDVVGAITAAMAVVSRD